jgi:hypothetical protein
MEKTLVKNKELWIKVMSSTLLLSSIGFNVFLYAKLNIENQNLNTSIEKYEHALSLSQKKTS